MIGIALAVAPLMAQDNACNQDPAAYSGQGYAVGKVSLRDPLFFFQAVSATLKEARAMLPLQPGGPFTAAAYSAGVEIVAREVKAALGETTRVKVVVVTASLENCRDRKLDAVYYVFAFNFPAFAAPRSEIRKEEMERPAPAAAENNVQGNYFTAPVAGYNATRKFFGGMSGSAALKGGPLQRIAYEFSGSGSSSTAAFAAAGARDFHRPLLDHADYELGFVRSDVPSVVTGLRTSVVQMRFTGNSAPHTWQKPGANSGVVAQLRYAASLEGGNQQSGLASAGNFVGSSPAGAFRLAVGGTLRSHRQAAAFSYGLQLGSTRAAAEVDYVKQVFHGEWNGTLDWPWKAKQQDLHSPIHLQARGGLGKILISGGVPYTGRFYGGNTVAEFLPGSDWQIPDGPLIRSIAQNRLAGAGMGGDSFAYIGFTVAPTVWSLPLVPRTVVSSRDFQAAKEKALDAAVTFDKLFFEADDPAAKRAALDLDAIKPEADAILDVLTGLEDKVPAEAEEARVASAAATAGLSRIAGTARSNPAQVKAVPGNAGKVRRSLEKLDAALAGIPALQTQRQDLATRRAHLQSEALKLQTDIQAIDEARALAKAQKDMAVVRPILDTFLNELNGLALSPVFIADVASLRPDPLGTHYGLGLGIRFTVFNLNLTGGYAINPHPHPEMPFRQGHGALFFSFEVADLFR